MHCSPLVISKYKPGISVSRMTGYGLDDRVSIAVRGRRVPHIATVQWAQGIFAEIMCGEFLPLPQTSAWHTDFTFTL